MAMSRIFVDRTESTLNESGDFLIAREEGAVSDDDIVAELGEVLIGENPGRRSDDEITLFVSLGLAVEDIAAANVIYRNAVARGVGHRTEFGGRRHG
jgi:ornithine cyclodeaminase